MTNKFFYCYLSPIGPLYIAQQDVAITDISFHPVRDSVEGNTPLIERTKEQLEEYFNGQRRIFDIPLRLYGTDFQKRAWDALLKIPYGQTRSYKEQSEIIGNAKAYRAVGLANGKNPISIIVPCHRVIGADNKLTGYGGGLDAKKFLLDLEQENSNLHVSR